MKKLFTLFIAVASMHSVFGQSYTVTQIPYNPMPFDSGVIVAPPNDDAWGGIISIGFDFYFFGVPYQQLIVGTNGIVSFDFVNNQPGGYCIWPIGSPIPSNTYPKNSIMCPFEDLYPAFGNSSRIKHQIYGTIPNRLFVVSYDSVPFFSCNTIFASTEIILHENSGDIDVMIKDKPLCSGWNGGNAILGIQNDNATVAYFPAGHNYPVQWSENNTGWRFSPDSMWAPPPGLNRISGRVTADVNNNCVFDSTDYPLWNRAVIVTDSATQISSHVYSDLFGYYSKHIPAGTYDVSTVPMNNLYYSSACPASGNYHISFVAGNDSSDNNNFADTLNTHCNDFAATLHAYGEANNGGSWWGIPLGVCDTGYIDIHCSNIGTMGDTAILVLTLNDSTTILNSLIPYSVTGLNEYTFNVGYYAPTASNTFTIMVLAGCDTIGTPYTYSINVSGHLTDCDTSNNNSTTTNFIGVPFDPNSLYVYSAIQNQLGPQHVLTTTATDHFLYHLTFQNTGSAPAQNVKVKIGIAAGLDKQTLTCGVASHTYNYFIQGDTLILDFLNINLPDSGSNEPASHGYIDFTINQLPGNITGTIMPMHANIYFDYMPAVLTNNAVVQIDNGETSVASIDQSTVRVFPNPASESFWIVSKGESNFELTDLSGRLLMQGNFTDSKNISVIGLADGIYLLNISAGKNLIRRKVEVIH